MGSDFIAETDKIRKAFDLINQIESEKFPVLAQRIATKIHSSTETPFSPAEIDKIAKGLGLTLENVQEIISTIEFVYQQACYEMIKPASLKSKLVSLRLDEDKSNAVSEIWRVDGKAMMERMRQTRTVSFKRLRNVNWRLNLTLASDVKSRQKAPNVLMEFNIVDSNNGGEQPVQVEFDRDELNEFLNKLDVIQKQLDTLSAH